MVSCNFSPEDPCCHSNQPFLFKNKIGCRLTRASNAETQLLGYIAWQWDKYLVPQNVFLVQGTVASLIRRGGQSVRCQLLLLFKCWLPKIINVRLNLVKLFLELC